MNVVFPSVADRRDRGKESWPAVLRPTWPDLVTSLTKQAYFLASYGIEAGRVDTASSSRAVRPFRESQKFGDTVQDAVKEQLRATSPGWHLPGDLATGAGPRRPADRLRSVLPGAGRARAAPQQRRRNPGDHGRARQSGGEGPLVHDVRECTGMLPLY
ncbi:hypothetical protein [Streptomyces anulatus]|uniref:hypothetical protein n=1 Tax=Streptomyces anulatus TaxID=1892 RepID=UPI0033EB2773